MAKEPHEQFKNIKSSFPEYSHEEASALAKTSMEHMFQLFIAEAVKMPQLLTPTSWEKFATFRNVDQVTKRLINKEPTIFITGHCGNWELLGLSSFYCWVSDRSTRKTA